jgi:hypothetical protein
LRKFLPLILLACLAAAGCWQSKTRPYRNEMSLQPFAAGTVTVTGRDSKAQHYALHKIEHGRYRLTETDHGRDFGEGLELGLFPLPGAPSRVLVAQAAMLSFHAGDDNLRYYGLLIVTGANSAQEIVPDCYKDARSGQVPRAYRESTIVCAFPGRASLEKSLLALWKSGKKPDASLRFEAATGSPR